MPSEKVLIKKKKQLEILKSEFSSALVGVLVNNKGIDVVNDTVLRKSMRDKNIVYKVIKNTILKRVFDSLGIIGMNEFLNDNTAIAISKDSYSSASKIICEFSKKNDFFTVKAGFVEGKMINAEQVKALAKLLSKKELISQVLRGLNSPIVSFVTVTNGIIRSFVLVISAILKKKNV